MGQIRYDKIAVIRQHPKKDPDTFFATWLELMRPFHGLTVGDMRIATAMLVFRYSLVGMVRDEALQDRLTLGPEGADAVCAKCRISRNHLGVVKAHLREKGFIKGDAINRMFLPDIFTGEGRDDGVNLLIHFSDG